MKDELVSIITPVFNSEVFLHLAIESIQCQTYKNWELILIDDSSTDSSISIIQKYAENDSRIRYFINETNSGAAISRNIGLNKSIGRFIAFIDSDDIWACEKLEMQVNFMITHNYAISFTSYDLMDCNGLPLNKTINSVKEIDYKGYLKNTIIGMSTSMIDRSRLELFEFVNIRTRQDTYLWITLLKRGLIAYGINSVLVSYRVRNDSISSNKLKAAKQVWFLYYHLEKLGLLRSVVYFIFYVYNALKKRI